jgi:hypothetical protein
MIKKMMIYSHTNFMTLSNSVTTPFYTEPRGAREVFSFTTVTIHILGKLPRG